MIHQCHLKITSQLIHVSNTNFLRNRTKQKFPTYSVISVHKFASNPFLVLIYCMGTYLSSSIDNHMPISNDPFNISECFWMYFWWYSDHIDLLYHNSSNFKCISLASIYIKWSNFCEKGNDQLKTAEVEDKVLMNSTVKRSNKDCYYSHFPLVMLANSQTWIR